MPAPVEGCTIVSITDCATSQPSHLDRIGGTPPLLDLAGSFSIDGWERRAVADRFAAIARDAGLFYVTNHRVPQALIDAQFALARDFFALDRAEKLEIDVRGSNCFRGYEAFGTQTIDASAPGDRKEGFIMGPDLPPDHPHVIANYPNTGANRWPRRPAGFRSQMLAFVAHMNELGRHIARIFALSLDLAPSYFDDALADPLTYSQLFHYPPHSAKAITRSFGAGAHVDWGLFTILAQDDVGGLEVRAPDGTWHAAPPQPGTLAIILGELVVRLTNGRYRAAMHRVAANTSTRGRYSTATFIDPHYDYRAACVPTCLPPDGLPHSPAPTVAEHMIDMARSRLPVSPSEGSRSEP
jgi:isopenicillin N synthase-like dioxygenase